MKFFTGFDLDGTRSYTVDFWPSGAFKSIVRPVSYKYITIGITSTGGLEILSTNEPDETEASIAQWWNEHKDSKRIIEQMLDYQVRLIGREVSDEVCDELERNIKSKQQVNDLDR